MQARGEGHDLGDDSADGQMGLRIENAVFRQWLPLGPGGRVLLPPMGIRNGGFDQNRGFGRSHAGS